MNKDKALGKYFSDGTELVYRRKLNLRSIADELVVDALNTVIEDGEKKVIDAGLNKMLEDVIFLTVEEFITKLNRGVKAVVKEL